MFLRRCQKSWGADEAFAAEPQLARVPLEKCGTLCSCVGSHQHFWVGNPEACFFAHWQTSSSLQVYR